jgi:hypothetical protein
MMSLLVGRPGRLACIAKVIFKPEFCHFSAKESRDAGSLSEKSRRGLSSNKLCNDKMVELVFAPTFGHPINTMMISVQHSLFGLEWLPCHALLHGAPACTLITPARFSCRLVLAHITPRILQHVGWMGRSISRSVDYEDDHLTQSSCEKCPICDISRSYY